MFVQEPEIVEPNVIMTTVASNQKGMVNNIKEMGDTVDERMEAMQGGRGAGRGGREDKAAGG